MSVPKLYWRKSDGGKEVTFNGAPFSVDKEVLLDCQYGVCYWKEKAKKNVQLQIQTSRKLGCHAHVKIRYYTVYPDFKVEESSTNNEARRKKKKALDNLKEAIINRSANGVANYFVSLPTEAAHTGHPTGKVAGFSQRVHPIIIEKIKELVASGITDVHEVKKILKYHVQHDVIKDHEIDPSLTNRAFYPMPCDIKNHICLAKRALELSKLDQENLKLKIEKWKKSLSSSHFFRPFIERKEQKELENGDDEFTEPLYSQTLLWVHQEEWQKELLVKFGNVITLIDATYKTTKYEVPLFFLSVKTNVNYVVVAEFIIQSETATEIGEALSKIKEWNPTWDPAFFMSDYSEAESLAIENVFPHTTLYLCDFHREQAWERWIRDHKHGLTREEGECLLAMLRECAHAPLPAPSEKIPFDYYFQKALSQLKKSDVWSSHPSVQHWISTYWLGISQVSR